MSKTLVAYFSRAGENYFGGSYHHVNIGNTEVVAMMVRDITGADTYRIDPVTPYSDSYQECIDQAKADQQAGARPEIVDAPADLDGYDTIYLGYPNYWGTMPMHVFTFLERYDLSGKVIMPFCTHEGSGLGRSESDIRRICPDSDVRKGLAVNGSRSRDALPDVKKWISGQNL